jgi:hypothetical protein
MMKAQDGEFAEDENSDVNDNGAKRNFALSVKAGVHNNLSQCLCDQHSLNDRIWNKRRHLQISTTFLDSVNL